MLLQLDNRSEKPWSGGPTFIISYKELGLWSSWTREYWVLGGVWLLLFIVRVSLIPPKQPLFYPPTLPWPRWEEDNLGEWKGPGSRREAALGRALLEFSIPVLWLLLPLVPKEAPLPAAVLLLLKSILYSIMRFHCPPSHSAVLQATF